MKTLLAVLGVVAVIGAGFSTYTLNRTPQPQADVEVIAHGEEVDLAAHAVHGKFTVFDFYAAWCPPCRILSPALERLGAAEIDRLAIRKIDIVDWTMPVAAQHRIESLPHLVLFDQRGELHASGDEVFTALLKIFGESAHEVAEATDVEFQEEPLMGVETDDARNVM